MDHQQAMPHSIRYAVSQKRELIQCLKRCVRGWAIGDDVARPMREAKALLIRLGEDWRSDDSNEQ